MTKIEWCRNDDGSEGVSWNALRAVRYAAHPNKPEMVRRSTNHCEHVNEACRNCYAEKLNARLGGLPFKPGNRHRYAFGVDQKKLLMPLRLRRPTRIFVESMSDLFGAWWPDEMVDQVYAVMALTPQHTYVDLSKRPERRREYLASLQTRVRIAKVMTEICGDRSLPGGIKMFPLPNVIEGTSGRHVYWRDVGEWAGSGADCDEGTLSIIRRSLHDILDAMPGFAPDLRRAIRSGKFHTWSLMPIIGGGGHLTMYGTRGHWGSDLLALEEQDDAERFCAGYGWLVSLYDRKTAAANALTVGWIDEWLMRRAGAPANDGARA